MQLLYDERDDRFHQSHGSAILDWLVDLDAKPLSEAGADEEAFLFAGARSIEDYRALVAKHPSLQDRPEDREPLLRLDSVLDAIESAKVQLLMPRTWRLPIDAPLPNDLIFPLFVRTAFSSWKLGGKISKVKTVAQLESEAAELRRAMGWDALILARSWCEFASSGRTVYGSVAREIRTWIIDGKPFAWSFHYLSQIPNPKGFPLSQVDMIVLETMAARIGKAFTSRLVAADFAQDTKGNWIFIEAGPGSCAGTAHEMVFKAVAGKLRGGTPSAVGDLFGGLFGTE